MNKKCKIIINVLGDSIELSVESSQLPKDYKSLRDLLIQLGLWKNFLNKVQNSLKSTKETELLKVGEIVDSSDYVITNITISTLRKRFPTAGFPEDSEDFKISDKKVRYMKEYKTEDGRLRYGRLINEGTGEEVFIVDTKNLKHLANYFLFCKSIISDKAIETSSEEVLNDLEGIYKEVSKKEKLFLDIQLFYNSHRNSEKEDKILKLKSLLITFVQNRNAFKNITFSKNGENYGIYSYLNDLANKILKTGKTNKEFSDPQIQSLFYSGKWDRNYDEKTYLKGFILDISSSEFKLKISKLLDEINEKKEFENKEIRKRNKNKDKESKEKTIKLETENTLLDKKISEAEAYFEQLFGKETLKKYDLKDSGWKILISEMLNKDKSLNLKYNSESERTIVLESYFTTLESAYGIGFDTLKTLPDPIYYNQHYILKKRLKDDTFEYYVTKYYTTSNQFALKFLSLEDAQKYIDSMNLEIVNNSFKKLHIESVSDDNNMSFYSPTKIDPRTVIAVLDYKVPDFKISDIPEEMRPFVSNNFKTYKMKDFLDFVKDQLHKYLLNSERSYYLVDEINSILKFINTPEKVFLFVRLLNTKNEKGEFIKSNMEEVLNLAKTIGELSEYKYYFVKSYKNGIVRLIPILNPKKDLPEYRKDSRYPIRSVIEAAHKVLSPRLGDVKMNIITNEEAEKLTGSNERHIAAKAFIMNGEIYINKDLANPEDLFHEYSHILLGYLKNNKDENVRNIYYKLLEEVWNLEENALLRENIMNGESYKDYARIDLMEELFAIRFALWVNDNSSSAYDSIFYDKTLTSASTKLFDPNNYSKSIKELFGESLSTVLLGFNQEISQFLRENPTLADDYENMFTLSRKKAEWIRKQKNLGNLIERNC